MNTQGFLKSLQDKFPDMLEGAVEYAYQRGDLTDSEYRTWIMRTVEVARKNTQQILEKVA